MKTLAASLLILVATLPLFGQQQFDIVYLADPQVVCDLDWLHRMKTDWHATAINLRIRWHEVEDASHRLNWQLVDRALRIIDSAGLGIYIRVSMNVINPAWYGEYSFDDFHQRYDSTYYLRPYWDLPERSYRRMLNFRAPKARKAQVAFFRAVVAHLNSSPYARKITLIVPTISVDDESEYPTHTLVEVNGKLTDVTMMSGYSAHEINAFISYVRKKYRQLGTLNRAWGSAFVSFQDIGRQMRRFGWHEQPHDPNHSFRFPEGRKDWLDFRTLELKNYFDTLCTITKTANRRFRFGLQFGSFYDRLLIFRGFYDPTPLLEKVDFFITDEIAEYRPNFEFAANYSRTLARYWNWKNRRGNNPVGFATESNWPSYGFDEQHPKGYPAEALCKNWGAQLETFHRNGASAHFVSLWGTMEAIMYHFADSIKSGFYMRPDQYLEWSRTLARHKHVATPEAARTALHLGPEQALKAKDSADTRVFTFGESAGIDPATEGAKDGHKVLHFYQFPFAKQAAPSTSTEAEEDRSVDAFDIVTDYIIEKSPEFLATYYDELQLTRSSRHMTKAASRSLQSRALRNLRIRVKE
ncbi:MAG: beta-galactosidase [Bacteroidetes bacterium]|nr:beta-galactosidase [Bacteroidota bacterium]